MTSRAPMTGRIMQCRRGDGAERARNRGLRATAKLSTLPLPIVAIEDRHELGEHEQVPDPASDVAKARRRRRAMPCVSRRDQLAKAGAVHVSHLREINTMFDSPPHQAGDHSL